MVPLSETIRGFKMILSGEMDEYPEQAFLNVGTIDDAIEKGITPVGRGEIKFDRAKYCLWQPACVVMTVSRKPKHKLENQLYDTENYICRCVLLQGGSRREPYRGTMGEFTVLRNHARCSQAMTPGTYTLYRRERGRRAVYSGNRRYCGCG